MQTITVECQNCHKPFERKVQRGRPAVRCEACRTEASVKPIPVSKALSVAEVIAAETEECAPLSEPPKKSYSKYDETFPYPYRLMISGIGLMDVADEEKVAIKSYNHYCKRSQMGFGKVGFEIVQLWKLNTEENKYDMMMEFKPALGEAPSSNDEIEEKINRLFFEKHSNDQFLWCSNKVIKGTVVLYFYDRKTEQTVSAYLDENERLIVQ